RPTVTARVAPTEPVPPTRPFWASGSSFVTTRAVKCERFREVRDYFRDYQTPARRTPKVYGPQQFGAARPTLVPSAICPNYARHHNVRPTDHSSIHRQSLIPSRWVVSRLAPLLGVLLTGTSRQARITTTHLSGERPSDPVPPTLSSQSWPYH